MSWLFLAALVYLSRTSLTSAIKPVNAAAYCLQMPSSSRSALQEQLISSRSKKFRSSYLKKIVRVLGFIHQNNVVKAIPHYYYPGNKTTDSATAPAPNFRR